MYYGLMNINTSAMEPELLRRAYLYSLVLRHCILNGKERELRLLFQQSTPACASYELITLARVRPLSHPTLYMLLKSYCRQHPGSNWAFVWCAEFGFLNLLSRTLDEGADLHFGYEQALRVAATAGQDTAVLLLLERGADLHIYDDAPLYTAVYCGHKSTVQLLLDHRADVHAGDERALRWAVLRQHYDVARVLIEHGAHVPTALQNTFNEHAKSWLQNNMKT